jgi:hypothetical protein
MRSFMWCPSNGIVCLSVSLLDRGGGVLFRVGRCPLLCVRAQRSQEPMRPLSSPHVHPCTRRRLSQGAHEETCSPCIVVLTPPPDAPSPSPAFCPQSDSTRLTGQQNGSSGSSGYAPHKLRTGDMDSPCREGEREREGEDPPYPDGALTWDAVSVSCCCMQFDLSRVRNSAPTRRPVPSSGLLSTADRSE